MRYQQRFSFLTATLTGPRARKPEQLQLPTRGVTTCRKGRIFLFSWLNFLLEATTTHFPILLSSFSGYLQTTLHGASLPDHRHPQESSTKPTSLTQLNVTKRSRTPPLAHLNLKMATESTLAVVINLQTLSSPEHLDGVLQRLSAATASKPGTADALQRELALRTWTATNADARSAILYELSLASQLDASVATSADLDQTKWLALCGDEDDFAVALQTPQDKATKISDILLTFLHSKARVINLPSDPQHFAENLKPKFGDIPEQGDLTQILSARAARLHVELKKADMGPLIAALSDHEAQRFWVAATEPKWQPAVRQMLAMCIRAKTPIPKSPLAFGSMLIANLALIEGYRMQASFAKASEEALQASLPQAARAPTLRPPVTPPPVRTPTAPSPRSYVAAVTGTAADVTVAAALQPQAGNGERNPLCHGCGIAHPYQQHPPGLFKKFCRKCYSRHLDLEPCIQDPAVIAENKRQSDSRPRHFYRGRPQQP